MIRLADGQLGVNVRILFHQETQKPTGQPLCPAAGRVHRRSSPRRVLALVVAVRFVRNNKPT